MHSSRALSYTSWLPAAGLPDRVPPPMTNDLRSLCELLREAIAATRLTSREVEEALGIGHGKLERMLNGQLDLRVRHILALAAILKVSPGDFFILGCPGALEAA